MKLPDIDKVDDNSFAVENVTVEVFPDDYAYILNDADEDDDPVYWADPDTDDDDYEELQRTILIRPESTWQN